MPRVRGRAVVVVRMVRRGRRMVGSCILVVFGDDRGEVFGESRTELFEDSRIELFGFERCCFGSLILEIG